MSEPKHVTINGETFTEEDVDLLRWSSMDVEGWKTGELIDLANRLARAMGMEE